MSYKKASRLWCLDRHCHYCDRVTILQRVPTSELAGTVDHKKPVCHGGGNRQDNLVLACFRCNIWKGNMEYAEFVSLLSSTPAETHPHYTPNPHAYAQLRASRGGKGIKTAKRKATRMRARERAKYIESIGRYPDAMREAFIAAGVVVVTALSKGEDQ